MKGCVWPEAAFHTSGLFFYHLSFMNSVEFRCPHMPRELTCASLLLGLHFVFWKVTKFSRNKKIVFSFCVHCRQSWVVVCRWWSCLWTRRKSGDWLLARGTTARMTRGGRRECGIITSLSRQSIAAPLNPRISFYLNKIHPPVSGF